MSDFDSAWKAAIEAFFEPFMAEIREIGDVHLLQAVLDAVPLADTPQALRQVWLKT